jgi:hypothetical protein
VHDLQSKEVKWSVRVIDTSCWYFA